MVIKTKPLRVQPVKVARPKPYLHENVNYGVGITVHPQDHVPCYGIQNRKTKLIEAYAAALALAIKIADEFDRDLRYGIDREEGKVPTGWPKFQHVFTKDNDGSGPEGMSS